MVTYSTREIDRRFELLDRYERRCTIHFLRETEEGHAQLADVVSHLHEQAATPSDRDVIETALNHQHLPKLAAVDAIEYDHRSETVRYHPDSLIEDLLDVTPESHLLGP